MEISAKIESIEASLKAIGIIGPSLETITSLIRLHARPDFARQTNFASAPWHGAQGLGGIAAEFLASSLRRKELIGRAADDPSWNMLLAIFSNNERGAATSVSSACSASGAALTTALRHVDALVKSGLIKKTPDPTDLRKSFLSMTPFTLARMTELIRSFIVEAPPPCFS